MGATQVTVATLIARKRAEIDVVMYDHAALKTEADRGTYSARLARERLHKEWDNLYGEWLLLKIRAYAENSEN